jgi:hypothetical protein
MLATALAFSAVLACPDNLLDAIRQVESSGGVYTQGDGGRAVGPYQLWKIYVDDVNRIAKTDYTYADRMDETKSREMVTFYLNHYGKGKTVLEMAAIHCAGPDGWRQMDEPKVKAYIEKVKSYLQE